MMMFCIGFAIGLLPILFFILNFDVFFFNNLGYHFTNAEWRRLTGTIQPISILSKMLFARTTLFRSESIILIVGIFVSLAISVHHSQSLKKIISQLEPSAFLAGAMLLISLPTALAPTPSYPQYYSMPVCFMILLLVFTAATKSLGRMQSNRILITLVVFTFSYNEPEMLNSIPFVAQSQIWSCNVTHVTSYVIRDRMKAQGIGSSEKVATLSPLFAVEANLPIILNW